MSDRLKRAAITALASALGTVALAYGVPGDLVALGAATLTGLLLGWAHLSKPGDK